MMKASVRLDELGLTLPCRYCRGSGAGCGACAGTGAEGGYRGPRAARSYRVRGVALTALFHKLPQPPVSPEFVEQVQRDLAFAQALFPNVEIQTPRVLCQCFEVRHTEDSFDDIPF